jgi:ABC-2 type transport system permease protein
MLRLELVRMVRIWSQTFLPPVVTSGLYFIVFGAFIGSQIAPIDGFSYMQFIVPGLIMMQIITSSYANVVSMFYFAKWTHNLDEVLVSPRSGCGVVYTGSADARPNRDSSGNTPPRFHPCQRRWTAVCLCRFNE